MPAEKAVLVHLSTNPQEKSEARISMGELKGLAEAAGAEIIDEIFQYRSEISPKFFIGKGKVEEISRLLEENEITCVIFDHNLSPIQQRHLEEELEVKVIDRTQLILDIFAQRAFTKEGKLQVELAQLNYLLPRLSGKGKALSRLGGGIGTRGPGEKKLEEDRRRIKDRITKIKSDISKVQKRRSDQRKSRQSNPIPTVSLVGYTNAGKSTLFNALTKDHRLVSSKLFATLDPVLRRVSYPDGVSFFLSDTVGFIRKLPVELISAFKATLEEVTQADCICHVIDITSSHVDIQINAVENILHELDVVDIPIIKVFNKIDLLTEKRELMKRNKSSYNRNAVYLSAKTEEGLPDLKKKLRSVLFQGYKVFHLILPEAKQDLIHSFPKWSFILQRQRKKNACILKVLARPEHMINFLPYIKRGESHC